jgi:hypothetical protein
LLLWAEMAASPRGRELPIPFESLEPRQEAKVCALKGRVKCKVRKTKSAVRNGETKDEGVKSYPCGSAPVWKTLAEVLGQCQSGCSQCAVAMRRSDGAGQRYSGGWRFGLIDARVPAPTAKRNCGFLPAVPGGLMRLIRQAFRVLRVATWRKWPFSSTIELPPRRQPLAVVTDRYKAVLKSGCHARLSGTSYLRPAVWGTQLDQSSRLGPRVQEMKGRSAGSPAGHPGFGVVSSLAQAAVGPGRASSRSNPRQAKQHPFHTGNRRAGRLVNRQVRKVQQ